MPSTADELFRVALSLAYGRRSKPHPQFLDAARLWKQAARSGHARSMFYLGVLYDHGHGVRRNTRTAMCWCFQGVMGLAA